MSQPDDPSQKPPFPTGDPPSSGEERDKGLEAPILEREKKRTGCVSPLSLLALLSVMLVLGAVLVPNFLRARARGQLTACKSNLKNIATALEMYSEDSNGQYPTGLSKLTPDYLKFLPQCPGGSSANYVLQLGADAPLNKSKSPDYYYIECRGENHRATSITGNYPAFNSIEGLIERGQP